MSIDPKTHKQQIESYKQLFDIYKLYASILMEILHKAANEHAPLSIVQVRPKSLSSYAEKIIRRNYNDPLIQMTDLCGARIIAPTLSEVDKICDFIKQSFIIDKKSIDKRTILKESEFGYLSMHYIVSPDQNSIMGVEIPDELIGRKAEIQVRTLLQHAWSDITHDRLYKTPINVPEQFERNAFQMAALLENADKNFNEVASAIDLYSNHYEAFIPPDQLQEEEKTLETILHNEPEPKNKPKLALKLSRIYREQQKWEAIISLLDAYKDVEDDHLRSRIQTELGNAYCMFNRSKPEGVAFNKGVKYLMEAGKPADSCQEIETFDPDYDKIRADALALLADAVSIRGKNPGRVRDLYCQACKLDESNPYFLASYLEYEIASVKHRDHIQFMEPLLKEAIDKCISHIKMGLELSKAWFTIAKLELLLDHTFESLSAYTRAIDLCRTGSCDSLINALDMEIKSIDHFNPDRTLQGVSFFAVSTIYLIKSLVSNQRKDLEKYACGRPFGKESIVIVSGGITNLDNEKRTFYHSLLKSGFESFNGTVISGGTSAGIPGIIGEAMAEIRKTSNENITLLGYIPDTLPEGIECDEDNYCEFIKSGGPNFSPREPLQYWVDLISNNVDPASVRLLGIGGGSISRFEYELALCLGAKVGLIENSGYAVEEIIKDGHWSNNENLFILPADPMTVKAFMNMDRKSKLPDELIEEAARKVHENFKEMKRKEIKEPSLLSWDELREDIKESNREQIRYMEKALRAVSFGIRENKDTDTIKLPEFSEEDIETMAEIEHGRWNVERLFSGWKFHETKDVECKQSPYIIPWNTLDDGVKKWDRVAVKKWPETLRDAGFEIYKIK